MKLDTYLFGTEEALALSKVDFEYYHPDESPPDQSKVRVLM